MWNDRLRFAESVEEDWKALSESEQAEARRALEQIDDDPIVGAPLLEPLRGFWSHRAAGLRIVYQIVTEGRFVLVLAIARAKDPA